MKAPGFVQGLFYKAQRLLSPTLPHERSRATHQVSQASGRPKTRRRGLGARFLNWGRVVVSSRNTWLRIKMRANLPKETRPHDLRHTFASRLLSSGKVDIYQMQKLLGHQDIRMTERYSHLADETLRKAAQSADEIFG